MSQLSTLVQTILVPQGVEYQAVCRGLQNVTFKPQVLAIPAGTTALRQQLQAWQHLPNFSKGQTVLLMGLCGGLTPQHQIGNAVLYQTCVYRMSDQYQILSCDRTLTTELQERLPEAVFVQGITSDLVIWSAQEKQQLAQQEAVDVVDMEGFVALENLHQCRVAMLRVVSDNHQHDIPDLTTAFNSDGSLQPFSLTTSMIRQPIAAIRLIQGSLKGLKRLQALTHKLFQ
jgi:hypothetical protein